MPRPNPPRTIGSEATLAERIAFEREQRGLTYEGLAAEMTAVGCPIDKSAIHRIEKGEPRRKVSVDEVVALTKVFGLSFEELLMPMALVEQKRGQQLAADLQDAFEQLDESVARILSIQLELMRLSLESPELSEYVTNLFVASARPFKPLREDERFAGLDRELLMAVEHARSSVSTASVDLAYFEARGIRPPGGGAKVRKG